MTDSTAEKLSQLALFADLPPPHVEAVAHTFDEQVFAQGQRVLRDGLSGSSFYVILDGEAAVVIDGEERSRLGRGEFFGEISALTGGPPGADVVATTMLRTLVIPANELEAFLLERPTVMLRMLQTEARRLQAAGQWRQ
jgi:CRP-like cAMP-binding protein